MHLFRDPQGPYLAQPARSVCAEMPEPACG